MPRITNAERKARTTRWIAVGVFIAGAAVSVAANIISAQPTVIGRIVAAWPALAFLFTIHLYQHTPKVRGWTGAALKLSVLVVIGVAAWISYWHIVEVTLRAGESSLTAHIMPMTIDAMMAVASAVATYRPKPARRPTARKAAVAPRSVRKLASVAALQTG